MLMVSRSMTHRAFAALSGMVALSAFGLAGCSSQGDSPGTGVGGTVAFSSQPEERGLMGPLDACGGGRCRTRRLGRRPCR